MMRLFFSLATALTLPALVSATMPSPFTRELAVNSWWPYTRGKDVLLVQNMLNRNTAVRDHFGYAITLDSWYGPSQCKPWVQYFQQINSITVTGVVNDVTANALLSCCSEDGYTDAGKTANDYGKKFKIVVPLPSVDRSVEATAWLLDKDNVLIRTFPVRTHGHRADGTSGTWPDYYNDVGCNQLQANCNTPTVKTKPCIYKLRAWVMGRGGQSKLPRNLAPPPPLFYLGEYGRLLCLNFVSFWSPLPTSNRIFSGSLRGGPQQPRSLRQPGLLRFVPHHPPRAR